MTLITTENYNEKMNDRSFKDFLNSLPHPLREMDDSGYTYLDYIQYKTKKHKRPVLRLLAEINAVIEKTGKVYQYSLRNKSQSEKLRF